MPVYMNGIYMHSYIINTFRSIRGVMSSTRLGPKQYGRRPLFHRIERTSMAGKSAFAYIKRIRFARFHSTLDSKCEVESFASFRRLRVNGRNMIFFYINIFFLNTISKVLCNRVLPNFFNIFQFQHFFIMIQWY